MFRVPIATPLRRFSGSQCVTHHGKVLYIIVCAAGPAGHVGRLVTLAQDDGWTVQIIATPPALNFIDVPELEQQTGRPIRSQYRTPGEPKSPPADAIIVAPATYNTINKFAQGIANTYALGVLSEALARYPGGRAALRQQCSCLTRAIPAQH
jgi:hypothetical protein